MPQNTLPPSELRRTVLRRLAMRSIRVTLLFVVAKTLGLLGLSSLFALVIPFILVIGVIALEAIIETINDIDSLLR